MLTLVGCFGSDMTSPGSVTSRIDGARLNAGALAGARALGQLCTISADRVDGTIQVAVLSLKELPFRLPTVHATRVDGNAPGRIANQTVNFGEAGATQGSATLNCVVPSYFSDADFADVIRGSVKSDAWRHLAMRLYFSKPTTRAALTKLETKEGREAFFEFIGAAAGSPGSSHVLAPGTALLGTRASDCTQTQMRALRIDGVKASDTCQGLPAINVTAFGGSWTGFITNLCSTSNWCSETITFAGGGGGGGLLGSSGYGLPGNWSYSGTFTTPEESILWSRAAHDSLLKASLRNTTCEQYLPELTTVSLLQDILYFNDNRQHYLRDPGSDPALAKDEAEAFIQEKLDEAHQRYTEGNTSAALQALGKAMHALMDRTSPAHVTYDGYPKEYSGSLLGGAGHSPIDWIGAERTADITPDILNKNRVDLTAACDYAMTGDH
ncbi:MAG TPA: hypothetical protein VI454_12865 [Verrucomicrobiae bacterium]